MMASSLSQGQPVVKNDKETSASFSFPAGWNNNKDYKLVEWTPPPQGELVYPRKLQAVAQSWIQLGDDIDGEAADDYSGDSVSLSGDGTVLAVGARFNDGTSGNADDDRGHVQVYKYDTTSSVWNKLGDDIDGEAAGDFSGYSVSLSDDGNILAVGATGNDGTSGNAFDNRGHVRVYKYDATSSAWNKLGDDIDGEAAGDSSGYSVTLSGDGNVLAVGAIGNDGTSGYMYDNRGHVRVFKYDSTSSAWNKLGDDIDGEGAGDYSGYSVSLSDDGNVLAVGATRNDGTSGGTNDDHGHVRVYKYDATSSAWNKLGDDIDGEAAGDNSGGSVSLSSDGTVLAVGATGNDGTQGRMNSAGHVRVFKYDANISAWIQRGADIDGEAVLDYSGESVSLSDDGNVLAVGATSNDGTSGNAIDNRGHVQVFKYDAISSVWNKLGDDIDGEATGDYSGYSVSLSGDGSVLAVGAGINDGTSGYTNYNCGHVRVFLSVSACSVKVLLTELSCH